MSDTPPVEEGVVCKSGEENMSRLKGVDIEEEYMLNFPSQSTS